MVLGNIGFGANPVRVGLIQALDLMDNELTTIEKRALDRLMKDEERWWMTRWLFVILAFTNSFNAYGSFARGEEVWPLLYIALGMACLIIAIVNWHGRPTRILLLRLMKDRDKA